MSVEDKVKRAKKGNQDAFQELIEEHKYKLYRMAYFYVNQEADALDIVQETVYKAYKSIKKLKDASYFSTWITRILINTSMDFIKKNKKVLPYEEINEVEDISDNNITDSIDLMDAINTLDPKYKAVIFLRYYRDLKIKDISVILECPENTVKTNIRRAINKLKPHIKGELM